MSLDLSPLFARAERAHAEGKMQECEAICGQILKQAPENVPALFLAGLTAAKTDRFAEAVRLLEQVVRLEPRFVPAHLWLSMVLRRVGQAPLALRHAQRAVELNSEDAFAFHNLGFCYMELADPAKAEQAFERATDLADVALFYQSLGLARRALGNHKRAIRAYRKCVERDPKAAPALIGLRDLLLAEGDVPAALEFGREVLALQPNSAESNLWVARLLTSDGRPEEAEPYFQAGLSLPADSAQAHSLLGSLLQLRGRLDDAEEQFKLSIESHPEQGAAYWGLFSNRRASEADLPMIAKMRELTTNPKLNPGQKSQLYYALGKSAEDLGRYEEAMAAFDETNRLVHEVRFGGRPFDRSTLDRYLTPTSSRVFDDSYMPVFVVGMIRSGTTLVEQILSCHPRVGGAGEQRYWLETPPERADPKEYVASLNRLAPGKERVVDKMPMNYLILGQIHDALPNAKIIHTVRDAADTAISIYTTPISTPLAWANEKAEIVYAYRNYQALMAMWQESLPPESILTVRYEDLVTNPEPMTRRMLEFLGLEWDDACLRPERNERTVTTPSAWQVRQPIYTSSIGRWRGYEPWLGVLSELIER